MDIKQCSQIAFGLVWEGRRLPSEFDSDDLAPPYDKGLKILQKPKGTKEDVAKVLTPNEINDAKDAVHRFNGLGDERVYDTTLRELAEAYRLGNILEKAGYSLKKGDKVELLPIYGKMTSIVSNQASGLTRADEINFKNYHPFMKSGYKPIDKILGGIPTDGPIIAYGIQGVGKSFFGDALLEGFLSEYSKKTAGIYTLEMGAEHYMWRALRMYPDLKKYTDRFYVSGAVHNIDELVSEVTTKRLNFVVLDDMDGIVSGISPEEYQKVYKRIREISRFLKIPVLVLAQPNRESKLAIQRGERFLSPYDIAWSSGSENAAALLIGLQRVSRLDMNDDPMFPCDDEEREFLIFWKSRDGWPGDYDAKGQMGPGAIRLEKGKQAWKGDVFQNKLWRPNSMRTPIGTNGKNGKNGKTRR